MFNTKKVEIGGLELELRLDGRSVLKAESALDESLMGLFMKGQGEMKIPPVNKILIVLHSTNQKSGVTKKMLSDAYLRHMDQGKGPMSLFTIVNELIDESGLFRDEEEETEESTEEEEEEILF